MGVREIQISEHFDQALPLMRENWAETGFGFEFVPDGERYVKLQELGVMFALGAFWDGELVGYSTALITTHLYNPAHITCMTDALFVRPEHRSGLLPGRLFLETERIARERGAVEIGWHTRAGTSLAYMLAGHGYQNADVVMTKELKRGS